MQIPRNVLISILIGLRLFERTPRKSVTTNSGAGFHSSIDFKLVDWFVTRPMLENLFFGDFDNNSFIDYAYSKDDETMIAFNSGDGSFQRSHRQTLIDPTTESPEKIEFEASLSLDINGDGNEDQVDQALSEDGNSLNINISLLEGNALSTVKTHTIGKVFSESSCDSSSIDASFVRDVDLNEDALPDIVVEVKETCEIIDDSTSGVDKGPLVATTIVVLMNQGDSNFDTITLDYHKHQFSNTQGASLLGIEDIDNDGVKDLILQRHFYPAVRLNPETMVMALIKRGTTGRDVNANSIPDDCERAVPGDFGGDRRSDITVVRESIPVGSTTLFEWYTRYSSERPHDDFTPITFGLAQHDIPLAGDFNGDGIIEPGIVRDSSTIPGTILYGLYWMTYQPSGGMTYVQWGLPNDKPLAGYYDSDNSLDRVVTRDIDGQIYWYIRTSRIGEAMIIPWGLTGDIPFSGDIDGDGIDELMVRRDVAGYPYWFIRNIEGDLYRVVQWGLPGNTILAPTDIDGDKKVDFVVTRDQGLFKQFYLKLSNQEDSAFEIIDFGLSGDIPYVGNFSSEDKADIAVMRETSFISQHYRNIESDIFSEQEKAKRYTTFQEWGLNGDYLIGVDGKLR